MKTPADDYDIDRINEMLKLVSFLVQMRILNPLSISYLSLK